MNDCDKCIAKGIGCCAEVNASCKAIRTVCECSIKNFIEWCNLKGYGGYDWRMLLEPYKKEKNA